MYSAYVYDYTQSTVTPICFYTSASSDSRLALSGAKLSLKKNEAGSFGFKMYPGNIGNDYFKTLTSVIEIKKDNQIYWRGRVISEERDAYDNRTITCEGSLNFLLDSVQLPMHVHSGILTWLQYLLTTDYHDSEAPEGQYHRCHNYYYTSNDTYKQFAIKYFDPSIELTEATDWYANYETTGELLKNVLEAYNLKMEVTYENGINNLSFYKDYPTQYISQQTITFGKNLISFTRNWEVDELATVVIPTGSKIDAGDERPTYPYTPPELDCVTTIESVNQGSVFLEADSDVIARYGRIYKKIDWSDISEPANLLDLAQNYLQNYQFDGMTIEIEVFDLSLMMTGGEKAANELRLLGTVHCVSQFHGLDKTFPITEMEIDFNKPGNTKFVLGEATDTSLTGTMESSNNATYKAIDANSSSASEIYNSVETGLDDKIDEKLEPYDTATTIHSWVLNNCYQKSETYTKSEVSTEAAAQAQTVYSNNITGSMAAATEAAVEQAKTNATTLINGFGDGGYVIFKQGTTTSQGKTAVNEIIISDRQNYTASDAKVWRWNYQGLGYSSTGYSGTYGTAITSDGTIVGNFIAANSMNANRIATGTFTADYINGGTITSLDSDAGGRHNMVLNLTNGHFFAKNLALETPSDIVCQGTPSDAYLYLGTSNWNQASIWSNGSTTVSVAGYTSGAWRCILGSHFGVTSDGVVACNYMKAGNVLVGGDFLRTAVSGTVLGNAGTFLLSGTNSSTLFGSEGTYAVAGASRSDWRLTVGNNFGVTEGGVLYSNFGQFANANVAGTISASSFVTGYINSGGTSITLGEDVIENNASVQTNTLRIGTTGTVGWSGGYMTVEVTAFIESSGTMDNAMTVNFYLGVWKNASVYNNTPSLASTYASDPSYFKASNFIRANNSPYSVTVQASGARVTITCTMPFSSPTAYDSSGRVPVCVYIANKYDASVSLPNYNSYWATPADTQIPNSDRMSVYKTTGGTVHKGLAIQGSIRPANSGVELLGGMSYLWKQLYATSGSIYTSSRMRKYDITNLTDNFDIFFDRLRPVSFRMKDEEDKRKHNGFVLDEVAEALAIAQIPKEDFAGYEVFNAGNPLGDGGLRYSEFIAINTQQIQKLKKRVSELEKLVEELERNKNESTT